MAIDPKFLRDVQRKGWLVLAVDEGAAVGLCPRHGCAVRLRMKPGNQIPEPCVRDAIPGEIAVDSFDHGRRALRAKRESLALTIRDTESCAGLADDHLAKVEMDDAQRVPNVDTFVLWANTLGYEVVLVPCALPPAILRILSETRDRLQMRRDKIRYYGARRRAKGA